MGEGDKLESKRRSEANLDQGEWLHKQMPAHSVPSEELGGGGGHNEGLESLEGAGGPQGAARLQATTGPPPRPAPPKVARPETRLDITDPAGLCQCSTGSKSLFRNPIRPQADQFTISPLFPASPALFSPPFRGKESEVLLRSSAQDLDPTPVGRRLSQSLVSPAGRSW